MLKSIRKNTKVIIWTVIVSFVLWGGFSLGTSVEKKGRIAGEIFGKNVTFQEFNRFYKSQTLFSFVGTEAARDPEILKQQTWQSLIFSREAKRLKIEVSDDEVRTEVLRLLALQKIENPTPEIYKRWVEASLRETPQEFESQVRELLRIQKLFEKTRKEHEVKTATEQEARELYMSEQSQVSADTLSFKTEDDAKKFLEAAKNAEGWKKETEKQKLQVFPTGFTPIVSWVEMRGLPATEAPKLSAAEKDTILGPYPQGEDFILIKVTDKKPADEAEFQKSFKTQYMEQVNNRRTYESFLIWQETLTARAKFKDYISPASRPAAK